MHAHLALRTGPARDVEFALRTALQVAEQRRDAALEGRALAGLAILLAHSDRVPEADGAVASALALAARSGDVEVRTLALASMGAVLEALGDTAAAAERYDEALSLTSGDGALNARAEMTTRSMMLWLRAGADAVAAKRADTLEDIARKQRCDALAQLVVCVRAVITAHAFPEAIGMQPFERAYEAARDEFVVESIFVLELRAYALVSLGSVEEAALVRDDAATAAGRCGWTSYARQLRES
jgi:tetratricopeptide (TPR) repeat protein